MADQAWTDEPLQSGTEDELGRLPYARRAAELIRSTQSFDSSAVFGLSGPWGSGKTSLVNMIVEELKRAHPDWAVARFTPWATSDVAGLLGEFYSSLAAALPKKKGMKVRRALAVTATVAAPAASLIPMVGAAASEGAKALGEALAKSPPWQVAFSKASDELKELRTPILVVVDDIDRLQGDELMALLKVVRLLGRFDGVQYLLAYDDETLYRGMTTSRPVDLPAGDAERFMEKIVQYPLFVPPLLRHQQISRLNTGLASTSRTFVEEGGRENRLSGLVDCFTSLLTTPRAIDRYITQLRHHIPLLPPDEVDDEDVQLLTLIRVRFPAMFNLIPPYRRGLTSGHTVEMTTDSRRMGFERFDVRPLLAVVPEDFRGTAEELLFSLFPKVRPKQQFSSYASERRQSVQYEDYFDRYFAMGILGHDVSDVAVTLAVTTAASGDSTPLRDLLFDGPTGRRALVLSKATVEANHPSSGEGRARLAEALASIANELPSDNSSPFGDQDQILSWIADLIAGFTKDTLGTVVHSVIEKLADPALPIRVWRKVERAFERSRRADLPPWYANVSDQLVRDSTASFLAHLSLGDAAEITVGVGYQVHFVLRHDAVNLRAQVRDLLDSGVIDLSVLASRLVSAQTSAGMQDWRLSDDFNQEAFDQLAPEGHDPWYDEPGQEVDPRDLSWANRRRFVTGRARPPRTPHFPADDAPADPLSD